MNRLDSNLLKMGLRNADGFSASDMLALTSIAMDDEVLPGGANETSTDLVSSLTLQRRLVRRALAKMAREMDFFLRAYAQDHHRYAIVSDIYILY
jgi:hypothetical protein